MSIFFKEYDIKKFGVEYQISGMILSNGETNLVCSFPNLSGNAKNSETWFVTLDEWKKLIRQLDLVEVDMIEKSSDGKLVKNIVRKTTRQIEQKISWRVFKRDHYECRYCGNNDTPLTVDHIILWEMMGPSIEENLLSSCKKCNKRRGNMLYANWLDSDYYKKVSQNLTESKRQANIDLIDVLDNIPLRKSQRSR